MLEFISTCMKLLDHEVGGLIVLLRLNLKSFYSSTELLYFRLATFDHHEEPLLLDLVNAFVLNNCNTFVLPH